VARMPGAEWQGEHGSVLMDRYDIVCVHTIAGFAPAHAAHFSVRWNGRIIQSRDTKFRSAANLDGNHRIIAIENEDHGPAFGGTPQLPEWVPLTDAQVEANARIAEWAHERHGIPLQMCPDSRPTSRGLAYHRQGIDGNFDPPTYRFPGRVPGGEVWTEHRGKVCPTDVRIAQLPEILRRARGDDMPLNEADLTKIRDIVREEVDSVLETDMNAHEPGGDPAFKGRSLRWVLKKIAKATGAV
jgi:hypothetical protein